MCRWLILGGLAVLVACGDGGGEGNSGATPEPDGGADDGGADDGGAADAEADGSVTCDPVTQEGCEAGDGCVVTLLEPNARTSECVTAGDTPVGQSCAGIGACQAGAVCLFGACRAYCAPDPAAADCLPIADGIGIELPSCDVFAQDCAASGPSAHACYLDLSFARPICKPELGGSTQGGTCERDSDCAAGFGCLPSGLCAAYCQEPDASCTGAGQSCIRVSRLYPVDAGDLGLCLP